VLKKARHTSSNLITVLIVVILLATAVFISGCSGGADQASEAVALQTALEPTAAPPTSTPETAVTPTVIPEEIPTDECLACHIDQEMLIKTADPQEEVINENEGEG
jgi:hypothetical protein